jgi:cytoskeletal protein CcmA (bactofilin family)
MRPLFDRQEREADEWSGFLERGVRLEGKIEAPGTFRIDSQIKGNVAAGETLILGEHATVEGEIAGNNVIIAGHFDGTIRARSRVEIQAKAMVTGEIHTPCLVLQPGAIFDGRCHIATAKEPAKPIAIPIRSSVVAQA